MEPGAVMAFMKIDLSYAVFFYVRPIAMFTVVFSHNLPVQSYKPSMCVLSMYYGRKVVDAANNAHKIIYSDKNDLYVYLPFHYWREVVEWYYQCNNLLLKFCQYYKLIHRIASATLSRLVSLIKANFPSSGTEFLVKKSPKNYSSNHVVIIIVENKKWNQNTVNVLSGLCV